jgi:hypothetical protein
MGLIDWGRRIFGGAVEKDYNPADASALWENLGGIRFGDRPSHFTSRPRSASRRSMRVRRLGQRMWRAVSLA